MDMSMSMGLGATLGKGVGVQYDPAASALFDRFTTPPTPERKALIDALIVSLKTAGAWANLDALWVFAAADSQAARQNWVQNLYNASAVAGPTFTADRGYTGDAVASYLDLGLNLTTPSLKATNVLNSFGVYVTTDVASSLMAEFGTSDTMIGPVNTGNVVSRNANVSPFASATPSATTVGWWSMVRDNGSDYDLYFNGALSATGPRLGNAFVSQTMFALARNNGAGTPTSLSSRRNSALYVGSLTPAQDEGLRQALVTYLIAIGAL